MPPSSPHLILVAGEASGDMHAAHLVKELKKLNPQLTFSGLGGPQMRASGVALDEDLTRLALIGFVEVIRHYAEIKKVFNLILTKIKERRPAAVILVDYPGFNLRLAKKIKKLGIKVIYYISPQVWAWKENRVHLIHRYVDKMLVLFPFEQELYARYNIPVVCVGHPLVDTVKVDWDREKLLSSLGLPPGPLTIGLLPGSRQKEIDTLLPLMLQTAELLQKQTPVIQFLLMKAPTIEHHYLIPFLNKTKITLKIVDERIYDGINACDACLVASGTATLETALLQKPMVVVYKTSFLTWFLAKLLIKIPYIGLVNVVAGRKIVPECIQFGATATRMADELQQMTPHPQRLFEIKEKLAGVKKLLGEPGATRRAAAEILKTI